MSPSDYYAVVEKHAKYEEGFVGSGVTFCAVVFEAFGVLSTEGMAIIKTVIGRAASRVAPHCAGPCAGTCQRQLAALRGESSPREDIEVR